MEPGVFATWKKWLVCQDFCTVLRFPTVLKSMDFSLGVFQEIGDGKTFEPKFSVCSLTHMYNQTNIQAFTANLHILFGKFGFSKCKSCISIFGRFLLTSCARLWLCSCLFVLQESTWSPPSTAACTPAVSPSRCDHLTLRTSPPLCPRSRWLSRSGSNLVSQFLFESKHQHLLISVLNLTAVCQTYSVLSANSCCTGKKPPVFFFFCSLCLQVSHSACVMTTAVICKLLRSKEAMATVDIRNWPPVLDTGTVGTH